MVVVERRSGEGLRIRFLEDGERKWDSTMKYGKRYP